MRRFLIDTSHFALLLFLIAIYCIGSITSFMSSWSVPLFLLFFSVVFMFIVAIKQGIIIYNNTKAWLIMTAICVLETIRGFFETLTLFYVLCCFVLLFASLIKADAYRKSIIFVFALGLIHSLACFWQFFFPRQYYSILYPLFDTVYKQSIRRQFTFHHMCTGLTSQTAITAEFIILGIMGLLYLNMSNGRNLKIKHILIPFIILMAGLVLTGKRSPLICLPIALIFINLITGKRDKKAQRFIIIVLSLLLVIVLFYFFTYIFSSSQNSIIRMIESFEAGDFEELSNGRLWIYRTALDEFSKNPIIGIGWGNFKYIYGYSGTHNIYIQLLCECGVIGFLAFLGSMIAIFRYSIRVLGNALLSNNSVWINLMKCSIFIQSYVFIYGMFGNPLYDHNYLLMYVFGIMISNKVASDMKRIITIS